MRPLPFFDCISTLGMQWGDEDWRHTVFVRFMDEADRLT